MKNNARHVFSWALLIALCGTLIGCGTTSTSQGASLGAVVGGLAGGWEGAAVGALAGGGVGLMADTAEDKRLARQQKEREVRAIERSSITRSPKTAYRPSKNNHLVGSTHLIVIASSKQVPCVARNLGFETCFQNFLQDRNGNLEQIQPKTRLGNIILGEGNPV